MKSLRWGILGTGNIAKQFAAGVATCKRSKIVAVGSRTIDAAHGFASAFNLQQAYGSYQEVLTDRNVDAIYNSLPNSMHHEWTIKSAQAGKHVLCEKPIAANAGEAAEMFDAADRAGVKLVEAFMYRSHPLTDAMLKHVRAGDIGEVKLIRSSFCYRTKKVEGNIRFDANLFGGALMDIGCYCINFSRLIAGGEPTKMSAVAKLHENGVDEQASVVLQFPNDVQASFTIGMNLQADNTAYICGDEGYIEIPVPWKPPREKAVYTIARSTPPRMDTANASAPPIPPRQTLTVDAPSDLYGLEADDFAASILDGAPLRLTREDSLGNMRVLDELRRQVGVRIS